VLGRRRLIVASVVIGLVAAGWSIKVLVGRYAAAADKAALEEQFRLARAEGLPTNAREFFATIAPVDPAENAAPYYLTVRTTSSPPVDFLTLEAKLNLKPSPKGLADAQSALDEYSTALRGADKALALPRCRFIRQSSLVFLEEYKGYQSMEFLADLIGLRGSLLFAKGDAEGAIRNAQMMLRVSRQAADEGTPTPIAVSQNIYGRVVRHLALWSFVDRAHKVYAEALAQAVKEWPKIDVRSMRRGDLAAMMQAMALIETPEGRRELGVKEADLSNWEVFAPFLYSRPKAKVAAAKAERELWEAYSLPPSARPAKIDATVDTLDMAMRAYPSLEPLEGSNGRGMEDAYWDAKRIAYQTMSRALAGPSIPTSVATSDLVSPFDGSPATYLYDGRQIRITVKTSTYYPIDVQIPSSSALSILAPPRRITAPVGSD